ncbi:MAG TPA: asparaginase [Rubricoccaceae bacterium]|jgi:L-asparaginase II
MPDTPAPAVLAEVTRGALVESVHLGHVAAVTGDGRLAFALGDPEQVVFLRSSAKPVQAFPSVHEGAAERFGFTDREVALSCGSHEGEEIHREAARSMLEKAGLSPDALRCGFKAPMNEDIAADLERRGEKPTLLHNECSGEHSAMLALAVHLGASTDDYIQPNHPVQRHVLEAVARFTGVDADEIPTGIDGCCIPTFAVPLSAAARLAVRLVAPPAEWDEAARAACERLVRAMTAHPEMVDGTRPEELIDSALMLAGGGRLVSKMGAEGLIIVGVKPCERWPSGLGVAASVADGDSEERARSPIIVALLHHLGILSDADLDALTPHRTDPVTDNVGDQVGEVRAAVFESIVGLPD